MKSIGENIRTARKKKGYRLHELASKLNLSISYLSQLENGRANINLLLLKEIASILDKPFTSFFIEEEAKQLVKIVRKNQVFDYTHNEKVRVNTLINTKDSKLLMINILPGCDTGKPSYHSGDELVYVIEGEVEVQVNYHMVYKLSKEDVVYYPGYLPHRWANTGDTKATLLLITISETSLI